MSHSLATYRYYYFPELALRVFKVLLSLTMGPITLIVLSPHVPGTMVVLEKAIKACPLMAED